MRDAEDPRLEGFQSADCGHVLRITREEKGEKPDARDAEPQAVGHDQGAPLRDMDEDVADGVSADVEKADRQAAQVQRFVVSGDPSTGGGRSMGGRPGR